MTGQSGPQDVARGVFIGLRGVAAGSAHECRLGDAVLCRCVSAGLAAVGRVAGIHIDAAAPSVFRVSAQYREELPPTSITDDSIESGFGPIAVGEKLAGSIWVFDGFGPSQHIGNLKVLDRDQVVGLDESTGGLW